MRICKQNVKQIGQRTQNTHSLTHNKLVSSIQHPTHTCMHIHIYVCISPICGWEYLYVVHMNICWFNFQSLQKKKEMPTRSIVYAWNGAWKKNTPHKSDPFEEKLLLGKHLLLLGFVFFFSKWPRNLDSKQTLFCLDLPDGYVLIYF